MNYLENYFDLSKFPKSTTEIVIKRLKKGMMMESEFAELIKERSLIEERYSNDLLKLNKKISQVDSEFVGPLENIFENVLKKNIEKSTIRKNFCKEILENLEKPLKSLNNFENFKFFEQESLKYLKDFELKNLKYLKHLKKKKSDNKLPALKLAMEQSKQTWQNESQKIFDSFFQMDENRIDFFKEILMKYITMDSNISQTEFTELQNLYIEIVSLESKFDILEFCKQNGNKGNADIKNEIGSSLSELESPSRRDSIRDSIKSFQRPSFGAKHHNVVSSQENIVASPQNDSERKIEEKDNFNNNLTQDARVQKEQENFSAYHIDSLKQNEVINEQTVQIVGIHNKHPQNVEEEQIGNQECNQRVQKDLNINPQSQFQHTDTHFGYNAQQQNGQQQNYHVEESINEVFQHEQNNQILKNMMVSSSPKVMENSGSVHTISDEGSEFKQTSPIKIDIKNYPIVEDEAAARNAMDLIASVLKPPTVNSVATARRRTTSQNRAQSVENPLLNSAFSIPVTQRSLSTNSPIFSHNPFLNSNQISQENVQENFEPYSSENKVTEVSISLNVNEQISILFNENNLIKVLLTGEVNLRLTNEEDILLHFSTTQLHSIKLKFFNFFNFNLIEKILPNENFCKFFQPEKNSNFLILDLNLKDFIELKKKNLFDSKQNLILIKYQLKVDETNANLYTPLLVTPVWKFEEGVTSLMVVYKMNLDAFTNRTEESDIFFDNLGFLVHTEHLDDNSSSDVPQMVPLGSWNGEKILWNIKQNLKIESKTSNQINQEMKLFARFNKNVKPTFIDTKFTIDNFSFNKFQVEVVDDVFYNGLKFFVKNLNFSLSTGGYRCSM